MTTRKPRRELTVRVEYEPNRFSDDCLQQAYQIFSPTTTAVALATEFSVDEDELDQQTNSSASQPSRGER